MSTFLIQKAVVELLAPQVQRALQKLLAHIGLPKDLEKDVELTSEHLLKLGANEWSRKGFHLFRREHEATASGMGSKKAKKGSSAAAPSAVASEPPTT